MRTIYTLMALIFLMSCGNVGPKETVEATVVGNPTAKEYELIMPEGKVKGLLVLFGGYPEGPNEIKREFQIHEVAPSKGIAVLMMTFNRRLWLEEKDKAHLTTVLTDAMKVHEINTENIYIGGFSSGGTISLLLANHLVKTEAPVQPRGVFIIDSPIDFLALYNCARRNIERQFSDVSLAESNMLINTFNESFGSPEDGIQKYEAYSPYTHTTGVTDNLQYLRDIKVRMYTEPDTTWWMENRRNEYEDMNAFYIKALALRLQDDFGNGKVEFIETVDKGYRSNGMRHPHSWSIVDKEGLLEWMDE